jgi:hypothetical protein
MVRIQYFGTEFGYMRRPRMMARYNVFEPAYYFELAEMLGADFQLWAA